MRERLEGEGERGWRMSESESVSEREIILTGTEEIWEVYSPQPPWIHSRMYIMHLILCCAFSLLY